MTTEKSPTTVGGGTKKILYTLSTIKRIGLIDSAKALKANNTCKACGLGMGGQRGGMINEMDEFPSVCNKSIQAQSTDIQKAIPDALFEKHPISDFQELSGYEIEHLGRLNTPIYKAPDADHFSVISWDDAIELASKKLRDTAPEKSFFYSSGRSSNEAGFLLQLFARLYGTNNVNNCSYYCHQATGVGLNNTIGSGTATVELQDLSGCDLVFIIGANPASNHPRLIHQLKALRDRGGHVIVINPAKEPGLVRFAVPKSPTSLIFGGTEIASEYVQPVIGGDIALLEGIAKSILESDAQATAFIHEHCQAFDEYKQGIQNTPWDSIEKECGVSKSDIENIAQRYTQSENTIFCWGMGITHHIHGVENVEAISNLALLRGMIGKPNAGLLPLRGHSNVQGIGTIGVKPVLADDVIQKIEEYCGVSLPSQKGMDTLACLEAAKEGNIDFALLMGGNLYAASPDSQWTQSAFNKIGFKLSLTTTLNHGHVNGIDSSAALVLPVCARDEEWEPTTQESMFNYLRMSDGGIKRLEGVRPESHILAAIAEGAIHASPIPFSQFKQHNTIRDFIAKCIPGMEELKDIDQHKQEFHIKNRLLHRPAFNTDNQRATFITHNKRANPANIEHPFTLMTVRSEGQFNSIIYEETDSYRATDNRWSILLSPKTIQALGITAEQKVTVQSDVGVMRNVRVYPFDLPDNNVMAYYPEANVLIGRQRDPRSHTPAFKAIAVSIHLEHAETKVTAKHVTEV